MNRLCGPPRRCRCESLPARRSETLWRMPTTPSTSPARGWLDPDARHITSQEKPMTDSGRLTVEDRLDIMDLLARYGACIDAHDGVTYAALWAPDGVRRIFPN